MRAKLLRLLRLSWACFVVVVGLNCAYAAVRITLLPSRSVKYYELFLCMFWFMASFLLVKGWQLVRACMRERLTKTVSRT